MQSLGQPDKQVYDFFVFFFFSCHIILNFLSTYLEFIIFKRIFMKYTVSFRNLYGNVEIANVEATAFEILDRALCFYRSKNNPDLDIPQEDEFFLAFNDWIHVSEAKEEVVSDKPN